MDSHYLYLAAVLLTATLIVSLKPLAVFACLIDRPDDRKWHHREIPLVGGIAIFIAFMASLAIAGLHVESLIPFTIASALLVSIGVWDDRHGLSPRLRLCLQAAVVLYLMLAGDVIVRDLGTLSLAQGTFDLRFMIYPFTMFGVLAIINAFNLSDGLDGLAGGLFLVPLLAIAMITFSAGRYGYMEIALLLCSVVAGFLLFNLRTPWRRHASIFLGSAGSTFLGIALSWLLIELSQDQHRVIAPAAVPWFFAVPFLDMAFVMSRRMLRGRSPFQPDREHIHHVLLLAGYSVTQSVMILLGLSALCIMFGYWGARFIAHDGLLVAAFIACACAYFMILGRTWKQMRFMGRPICRRRPLADRRTVDWQSVLGKADGSVTVRERRSGQDRRRDRRSLSDLDHAMPERVESSPMG